ncbi:glycoside hydrolase family 53 protein [Carboxylicivirga linearis]|uniref:Arabinogalactan endo-beta-1,4-galactanase n=1 Tax=Carboxylicivirga linearis TaxID=1628157 RepID=A0ABS5JVG1_9BACT|nr:glycosyl hydrolase 53 family protein [Carboxylicivirga linearis]MBS2098469.1 glycosyl hydrolase 53 family protein [Carboxylicivirga linearis]
MIKSKWLFAFVILFVHVLISSCQGGDKESEEVENSLKDKFMMGVDLSYINQVEDHGGIYKDNGVEVDPFELFNKKGANVVRLRIWNNPDWIKEVYNKDTPLYSGFEDVKKSIRRAKDNGMAVNLDFHYSDVWADPQHQKVPQAWKAINDINVLCDSVYHFTYSTLDALLQDGLLPEMVQIGNETNCGFMLHEANDTFPNLSICDDKWVSFGKVLNAGINAVRDIDTKAKTNTIIALHVADPKNLEWFFKGVIEKGGVNDFDVAGFSYYPHWHTEVSFTELPRLVSKLKKELNKELVVLETAYPYTLVEGDEYGNIFGENSAIDGYPISIEGQRSFMIDLVNNIKQAGGMGVMYWEPAWISSDMKDLWGHGSAWDNATLFDQQGNVTKAFDYLSIQDKLQ